MLLEKAKYFLCENNLSSEVVLQRLFKFYLILTRYFVSSLLSLFSRTTLYTRKTIVHICQFNMKVLKYFFLHVQLSGEVQKVPTEDLWSWKSLETWRYGCTLLTATGHALLENQYKFPRYYMKIIGKRDATYMKFSTYSTEYHVFPTTFHFFKLYILLFQPTN